MLNEAGSCFDIASRFELDKLLAIGVKGERLSYGNTIKKGMDIKYFYENGVRLFATDSKEDLRNIAANAPGSKIYVRMLVEGSQSADWPLSRKFGCHPDMAYDLLVMARELGLIPYGVSFHVGSQQRDIGVILAGPTCDSMDIMYEKVKYKLPLSLKSGDRLYWLSTGAYTSTYASVEFNGFPPLKTYYME